MGVGEGMASASSSNGVGEAFEVVSGDPGTDMVPRYVLCHVYICVLTYALCTVYAPFVFSALARRVARVGDI